MSTPRLISIPTVKRGRPQQIKKLATRLIGRAGVAALREHDLYIITGAMARKLALMIGEPDPTGLEPPLRPDVSVGPKA